jgi:Flp pilus assembly protein TadD
MGFNLASNNRAHHASQFYRDAWVRRVAWVRRSTVLLLAALLVAPALAAQDFSHPDSEPAPEAALIQQANDALAASDFAAALKILTGLNTQTPNNPQVLYDLGLTLEALGPETPAPAAPDSKVPTAEFYYRQSIAANPLFPAAHVALGLLLARTGRAVEAHSELLTATQLSDAAPALKARALRALAKLDQQASNPTDASAELLAALNLTPEAPEDIQLAAEIAESASDLPAAERAYRRYLALDPQDPQAIAALAHVLLAERRPADAEALLAPALAAHPGDPTLTALAARADLASADPAKVAQAAPLLEKLHAANPQDANITRLLARVYLETDHPDQADPLYAALLAAEGANPDPTLLDDRAEALLRLHRPGAAETLLKQAVANPAALPTRAALADAATHLAFAAAEIDDPRTTLQALALRATVLPPSPSTLYLEASANDSLHQIAKAIDLYKQFLAAAGTEYPDQASQARQRIAVLAPENKHAVPKR